MELRNVLSFLCALWSPGTLLVIRRLLTTSAFKLLRFVFGLFQAGCWQLNGTARQVGLYATVDLQHTQAYCRIL